MFKPLILKANIFMSYSFKLKLLNFFSVNSISEIVFSGYFWICVVSWAISIYCMIKMALSPDSLIKKLFWVIILLIPIFGPVFYGGLYKVPSQLPDDMKAPEFDHTRHDDGRSL